HRHACAAEHRVAAHYLGIADDQTACAAQFTQRRRQLATWFAQVDLDEPALEGNDLARRSCQGSEHLAPKLGPNTVREPPLNRERNDRARVEQPAAFFA